MGRLVSEKNNMVWPPRRQKKERVMSEAQREALRNARKKSNLS